MQLQGTIKYIGEVINRQGKDNKVYRSQKILLATTDGKYSQVYPIDIGKSLMDSMDQFSIGQTVKVEVNMRGIEYTNKTTKLPDAFLSLQAWKIEAGVYVTPAQQTIKEMVNNDDQDSLPF